ncbi:MAG: ATP-binding protein, partial [Proteobacteria bacterium]|nr:ATP-binding protein [Pseudomonadota bacterium]
FFGKTHITEGMRALIHEGFARLAGKSTQAVFHLKQAMGGGKTHLMVGFGLLARHEKLRTAYCSDVPCQKDFNTARVAAFNGRNTPDHYFWGEIAQQIGRPEVFKKFWESGPKAPDVKAWLALFDVPEPVLILLDEMPPYFHYLDTQKIGGGTVADVATRAFAGLLTAAGKKKNVCIVVSDLTTTYDTGLNLINRALRDATAELGRAERNITPVDLAGNEIYDILRKRLFKKLPTDAVIGDVASAYGKSLSEATKAKVISRSAEAIADEIASTYPFHPRLKNLVALFKENEKFKQTRGLMELASRLLKSVWERNDNDVLLIGPQHFDLSIPDVREKIAEISEMRDVIAKDLWDVNSSSHAQIIDLNNGNDAAAQVGALLLTASLPTAVNAVKGLTQEEMLECLVGPLREAADFTKAFEALETQAWYLHHTPEEKYYFDRQENLTKLLQSIAQDAPENQVEGLIRERLTRMFKPVRRAAYSDVLPLPKVDDIVDKVRKERVLLIISPDSKIPPEEVARLFSSLTEKNNVCVLTGDKTQMGSVEKAARQVFAAEKAEKRIDKIHPQREELEKKQGQFEQDLNTTILSLFDKVLHPVQRADKPAELRSRPLDMTRDTNKPFNGEEQVEKTLTGNPIKLILDVVKEFDAIRSKAEDLLWPMLADDVRWNDAVDAAEAQAGMYWLPPKGLEQVKTTACAQGLWEDLGNGYVTKKPKKKKTSVQVTEETQRDDAGVVRLRVNSQNAGPAPKIHYAEDRIASMSSP